MTYLLTSSSCLHQSCVDVCRQTASPSAENEEIAQGSESSFSNDSFPLGNPGGGHKTWLMNKTQQVP